MNYDNNLVQEVFSNLCIDKTRLPSSGLTGIGVPSFVAEWLLDTLVPGKGNLSLEESSKVNDFVNKAFPRKDDRNVISFKLTQGEVQKLIALMQVRVKLEQNNKVIPEPLATIPVLNLEKCAIPSFIVDNNPLLLRQGSWGKITLEMRPDGAIEVIDFAPFQCAAVNLEKYFACRRQFTTQAWQDLLFCSMGFNPEHPNYTPTAKTWMLARLLPLVEPNYPIIELAPKGTGKSFIFENISSKVCLVSGGKVSRAQLFINGRTREIGLLGRHDVVVLDEVQSLTCDNPEEIIGALKNYLASGRYNVAGYADVSSDCSLVMLANIELDEELRPRHQNNLMKNLPSFFGETAFLDRITGIIPGWEIPKFQREMAAHQVGLKMDFFGEALLSLRKDNRYFVYAQQHTRFTSATVRDQNAILKSTAGYLKLLYPHLELTLADFQRDCLEPARQLRQYIRDSVYHDDEFKQYGRTIFVDVDK